MKLTEDVKPQEDVTQKLCQAGKLGGGAKTVVHQEHSGRQKRQENLQMIN